MSDTLLPVPEHYASDPRPLPLIVAEVFGFRLASISVEGGYYSVQDWISGVAQTGNPRRFWSDLRTRAKKAGINLYASCVQLPYRAADGKTYNMDYTDAETLYLITQRMSAETGVRDAVLRYLARAGVRLDDMRLDPGKAIEAGVSGYRNQGKGDEWIDARTSGTVARAWFTAALQAALDQPQPLHFALASNEVYAGLWQRTAAELRKELALPKRASLRDHQPALALAYQRLAEMVIAQQLGDADTLTWAQAEPIIRAVARLIGEQAQATGQYLGVDLATGKRLLKP